MAVEIFTMSNESETPQRTYGNEVSLRTPSHIYFGKSAPGIAYYEKASSDLQITLLDGQEVTVRNFFVLGPEGGYSRLDITPNGPTEVSGMLAPEPQIPDSGEIPLEKTVDSETPGAMDPSHGDLTAPTGGATDDGSDTSLADNADGGGWDGFGIPSDQMIFGLASAPIAVAAVSGFDSGGGSGGNHTDPKDTAGQADSTVPAGGDHASDSSTPTTPTDATDPSGSTSPTDGTGSTDATGSSGPVSETVLAVADFLGLAPSGGDLSGGMLADSSGSTDLLGGGMNAASSAGDAYLLDLLDPTGA
ncbi:BapA/Bap/LapF family prefix-like domain-containing protein [Thioclava electrotropha]|uniref:Biofilm-associated protein BapA-like prefix-like domain-containing protein n=1 Tax=Thioclava electrotropha TaxID=1549850 RepID=A0ABX6Z149_9RHOB|nr:hypothetical protein [Thioclava electrotropha]QPZ93358.1 hypothetical protein AKL02_020470 [Thioclava electrotropha]